MINLLTQAEHINKKKHLCKTYLRMACKIFGNGFVIYLNDKANILINMLKKS